MYKALIIDDEYWILQGIKKTLNKYGKFLDFIQLTNSPEEALDFIVSMQPDVVFTDIRMPGINGLELIEYARNHGCNAKFIIVSGYDEFEYAKKALHYDVFDYLLKPLENIEVENLMSRLKIALDTRKQGKDAELFDGLTSISGDKYKLLSQVGFKPEYEYFITVIACTDDFADGLIPDMYKYYKLDLGTVKKLFIINAKRSALVKLGLCNPLDMAGNVKSVGISSIGTINDLPRLIHEADISSYGFFINNEYVINHYDSQDIAKLNGYVSKLRELFENKSHADIKVFLSQLNIFITSAQLGMEQVEYLYNQIIALFKSYYGESLGDFELDFAHYYQIVERYGSFSTLCKALTDIADFISSGENTTAKNDYNSVNACFSQLLEYVNTNYEKDISLRELSTKFFVNFTYCCALFKKETGMGFSKYVTALRMDKAQRLLSSGTETMYEIAQNTGYNDYYYFSKVFKKHFGFAPSEYRKKSRDANTL